MREYGVLVHGFTGRSKVGAFSPPTLTLQHGRAGTVCSRAGGSLQHAAVGVGQAATQQFAVAEASNL